uniref:Uncharacterized protein n=1 Tax=Chenopodium quinoa TaxID=63459 RepID=A0A803MXW2_CHEQI
MLHLMKDQIAQSKPDDRTVQPKLGYNPKLEFPKFDGSNPRIWIKKCCKYFDLCKIPENQKVDLASLNMSGKAENWISSYLANRVRVDWSDFVIDLTTRLKDEKGINVVEEFNKLQQSGSIESFVDEFENLRSIMLQNNICLPEKYLLESFIGGLKPGLRPFFRAFKPQTIVAAVEYVPADVRAEKIAKGLCYYCDAPYDRNHKCQFKEPQLFTIEIPGLDEVDYVVVQLEEQGVEEEIEHLDPRISCSALTGAQSYHTMRVTARVGDTLLHTLIDSGRTHNFLDTHMASKLGCKAEPIEGQAVMIADGNQLVCHSICRQFTWCVGGKEYVTDVMLIPLGNYDMVLGIQWLSTLGSISWNFKQLTMKFHFNGEDIELQGISPKKLKVLAAGPSQKLMSAASQICLIQVSDSSIFASSCMVQLCGGNKEHHELQELKQRFSAVFEEPEGLPLSRDSDLVQHIISSYAMDDNTQAILTTLSQGGTVSGFSLQDNLLRRFGKLVVGPDDNLKKKLLAWQHASLEAEHSGRDQTLKRLKNIFYWKGMSKDVSQFVRKCIICQASKYDTSAKPGALQPLPIPEQI